MARDAERQAVYNAEWPLRRAMVGRQEFMPGLFRSEHVILLLGELADQLPGDMVAELALRPPIVGHASSIGTAATMVRWFWQNQYGADVAPPVVQAMRMSHNTKAQPFSGGRANRHYVRLQACGAGFELATIAHETAHAVTYFGTSSGMIPADPGHGQYFRAAHVHVARYMLGEDVAKSLEACYTGASLYIARAFGEALADQRRNNSGDDCLAALARQALAARA